MLLKFILIMLPLMSFANAQALPKTITTTTTTTTTETVVTTQTVQVAPAYPINAEVKKFCNKLDEKFKEYRWGEVQCEQFEWLNVRKTATGMPLIWTTFGIEDSPAAENTTLILCGVHGDEITPVKFCWDLMRELKLNHNFKDKMVVLAPLVTPDSFFKTKPSRTNAAGVDVNRNFPTVDWKANAHKKWIGAYRRDKRKYPGPRAASEQETIFQMNLIKRYKPNKVITVHAPLTLLDYDGPSLRAESGKPARELLEEMSKKSSGYKVSNYPIFPGSLGNWAGKENHIPTYTLELPNSNPQETDKFFLLFKDAVIFAMDHKMKPTID